MEDPIIGTEVEGYRIQEVLGKGGMGVVYRAEDVALSRPVALKRIAPSLANDESFLRRFRSEAQALARIDSPYIVGVHALRQTEIGLLIVMEYVDGGTLRDVMDEGPMDSQEALPLIEQMLKALEHAHGAEVIHRDIKPRNVLLSQGGTVKVTDFGLAKVHRGDTKATVTQGVHGTLNYMSPEQVKGSADLDHRSDLYSLGMTVYEMLAGELPFDEDSDEFTQMRTIVEEELPRPHELNPRVPEGISALVMRAVEKEPDDRFQSAEAMREAFEGFEEQHGAAAPSEPQTKAPDAEDSASEESARWRVVAGLAVVALLLAGVNFWLIAGEEESAPPRTPLTVSSEPAGARVFLDGDQIGTTPLSDTTIEGRLAQIRVQRAGFLPIDTVAQLGGRERFDLDVSLTRKATPLSIRTEPVARVTLDGENVGRTPFSRKLNEDTVRVQVARDGYFPVDTTVSLADTPEAQLRLQLERRPDPPNPSPEGGSVTLSAAPSGTVYVGGERREEGRSIRVPVGSHRVRIEHPQSGACDTTLTVETASSHPLTCHFEHRVVVRSTPWANVYVDGENTGQSTPHDTLLGTGRTYEIGVRIQRGSFTVSGGTYRKRGTESGSLAGPSSFSGGKKTITLQPSFEREIHIFDFRTFESEP